MLKNHGRDPRSAVPGTPTLTIRSTMPQRVPSKPEPDYEVVEFPSEQYVNAKLQPPPPPPPRPPTNHPLDAGAACGLCGGGGARVRCTECGRRALCASCDDMYHRHPKRRHHQRQALSQSQLRDERPPLPPKATPPVPPPRRHKITGDRASESPRPMRVDPRRATLSGMSVGTLPIQSSTLPHVNHFATQRAPQTMQIQPTISHAPTVSPNMHLSSMPYLGSNMHQSASPVPPAQDRPNAVGHFNPAWNRPRGPLQGFNMQPNVMQAGPESWEGGMRRGASVMELGAPGACACAAPPPWRYGSCAALDHAWPAPWPACCPPHAHPHGHPPHTPQPYRRADSRAVSRAASRAGSRAASPAMSVRSRASRRNKHRTPSPPLPSSDADSESEDDYPPPAPAKQRELPLPSKPLQTPENEEDSLGPAPPPPDSSWQCEHCTFVNEPGVRVCAVCCRTPTVKPKIISNDGINNGVETLRIADRSSPAPTRKPVEQQPKPDARSQAAKEKVSTGCGPSPPREEKSGKKIINRLETPTRDQGSGEIFEQRVRHDVAIGPSPPKETVAKSLSSNASVRASPYRIIVSQTETPTKHSISVGPSPPRESYTRQSTPIVNNQNRSAGTSPPRRSAERILTATPSRTNVLKSNTGTSPPPQSISTQTYEAPSNWERTASVSRSRPRRRFRDDARRERSHSRHSLSSDTRESERSVRSGRTSGGGAGRWEWRGVRDERSAPVRDGSPAGDEWAAEPRSRLARRASHLDLRRTRTERNERRASLYGSEAPSPEPLAGNRAISLEALAGGGARREAERGLELARLMGEAERLGFSAAEVHAALAQNPLAPLSWLRERWPSLCAGVRAAAARLAPGAAVTELEARAALARHRGAMWPAVTECVERSRRQAEDIRVSEDGRMRGHVWGSPNGIDDDAAPPSARPHRTRAEESSDEYEAPTTNKFQDDDWMYLPLDIDYKNSNEYEQRLLDDEYANATNNPNVAADSNSIFNENEPSNPNAPYNDIRTESSPKITSAESETLSRVDIAEKLKKLLIQAGIPSIDENLLLKGLLSDTSKHNPMKGGKEVSIGVSENKTNSLDLTNLENDFINAYNQLTRSSPLPNINKQLSSKQDIGESEEVKNTKFGQYNKKNLNNRKTEKNKASKSRNKPMHRAVNSESEDEFEKEKNSFASDKIKYIPSDHLIQNSERDLSYIADNYSKKTNETTKEEEKPEKLRDMVDNTAKLIQQMKNEIHSDINSLNGQSKSNSEEELSSNESNFASDEDSKYSGSQNESDVLTSDEKELTSSEEETRQHSEKRPTAENRTSSEDNEHFEEAMDHLDNQIEDFKQTNIEILDSIAKSLQEEHTFSLEINEAKERNQDLNNNLFDAVNSFDEIYEQLNAKVEEENTQPIIGSPNQTVENNNSAEKPRTIVIKQNLNMIHYNPEFSTKVLISENKPDPLTATINNIEVQTIRLTNYNPEFPTKLFISENKPQPLVATLNQVVDESSESSDIDDHINLQAGSNDNKSKENIRFVHIKENNLSTDHNSLHAQINNTNELRDEILNNVNDNTSLDSTLKLTSLEANDNKLTENNTSESQYNQSDNNVRQESPAKSNDDSVTKSKTTNKSNIPKLIKSIQNNKTKNGNNTSKVISSKVPIRRASLKQYPAPSPPKSHFGNVQSGHVKQLQNQLFSSKQIKTALMSNEVKATTSSTLSKKKPAPQPPLIIKNTQQASPSKSTSPEEKKSNFFRETCRTEDEWTDSDSDENNQKTVKPQEREPTPVPSTPQPITLRRISGQFIDLAHVRLPEGSPERQARMLLAEGATESWEQAQLAVELISRGTEPAAALLAALECIDLESALAYLQQDCELCASKVPEHEMVSMLRCTHRCCRECAQHYYTVQISERSIVDCVCPYCKEPELENLPEDSWLEYFAHLDIQLKTLLDPDLHELFQRKLRDRTLARDPNFRWCVECSSGFFVHPKQKKLRCPECKSISCATCRKPWSSNHEGLTCEQYTTWLEDNDPEKSVAAVQQHLRENGLDCPRCHFKYSLSRGGCMHFTCTQCKYEFCYGCGKPFMMGARCGLSEYCARLGLHAHHPRNCLFYLRDKEPHDLQTLLQMNNVSYETEAPEGSTVRCPIQLQRETPAGLVDSSCGSEVLPNQAGLCKAHYVEYLAGLARALDPIPIMDVAELVAELRRRALPLPERGPWDTDPIYAGMCAEIVREKIPLD